MTIAVCNNADTIPTFQFLPVYMHVRVLVAAYLFQTGYGHFSFFWLKGDFGLYRVCQVSSQLGLVRPDNTTINAVGRGQFYCLACVKPTIVRHSAGFLGSLEKAGLHTESRPL